MAALLAVGGLWFAGSTWRTHALHESSRGADLNTPRERSLPPEREPHADKTGSMVTSQTQESRRENGEGHPAPDQVLNPGQTLAPPIPNRRFTDFTPEQRVEFARKGHGPGG
jgi:hypothetical protein